jgi:hypothetical protein
MRQHVSCTTKVSNEKPYWRGQASASLTTGDIGSSVEEFVDLGCGIELRLSSSVAAGLAGIGP